MRNLSLLINVVSQELIPHSFVRHSFIPHSLSLVYISEIKLLAPVRIIFAETPVL